MRHWPFGCIGGGTVFKNSHDFLLSFMSCRMQQGCCEQLLRAATRHLRPNSPGNCGRGCGYNQIFNTVLNTISRLSDSIIRALNTANIEVPLSADFVSTHTSPHLLVFPMLRVLLHEKNIRICKRFPNTVLSISRIRYVRYVRLYKLVKADSCCPFTVLCLHLLLLMCKCR
jgi:hypothetical protein